MKYFMFSIVLGAMVTNCTYSLKQYHMYHKRDILDFGNPIGDVVDNQERTVCSIFPDIEEFQEARFYSIVEGGYEVEIVTDRGKYAGVNRDLQAEQILRDYFSRYSDPTFNINDFQKKWKIVAYDSLGFPITRREVEQNMQYGCMYGSAACFGLASLALSTIFAFSAAVSRDLEETNNTLFFSILIGGTCTGCITGSLFGRVQDEQKTILAIKEARKARFIDEK